jgi:hypothetical protein
MRTSLRRFPRFARPALFFIVLGVCLSVDSARCGPPPGATPVPGGPILRSMTATWTWMKEVPQTSPWLACDEGDAPRSDRGDWAFSPNVRPHPETDGQHLWPDIAVHSSGLIAVAWMDDHLGGQYHIFYSASSDGGQSWSTPEQVDHRVGGDQSKFVDLEFAPAGIPVAVWEDNRTGAINVYLSRRDPDNGGTPWTPDVRVNSTGGSPSTSDFMSPSVAVLDAQRFFVAWTDWREGVFNQVYQRSTRNAGATWGPEVRISDEIGYQPVAGNPCLIVDPSSGGPGTETLYCVMDDWRGNVPGGRYPDAFCSRSTNGGASFSAGVRVNDIVDLYQQVSSHALVLLPDGTLTCGWMNSNVSQTSYRTSVSSDHGLTWQPSVRVDDPALGGTGTWSSIASTGNYVLAGMDGYVGTWNSYLRVSSDGGRTWPDAQQRMDDDTGSAAAQNTVVAAGSPGEMFGVWMDTRSPGYAWKIYTTRGTRDLAAVLPPIVDARGDTRLRCLPNPSRWGSSVELILPPLAIGGSAAPGTTRPARGVQIVSADGRLVRTLPALGTSILWDGQDSAGRPAAAGLYLVRAAGTAGPALRIVRVR